MKCSPSEDSTSFLWNYFVTLKKLEYDIARTAIILYYPGEESGRKNSEATNSSIYMSLKFMALKVFGHQFIEHSSVGLQKKELIVRNEKILLKF